MARNTPAGPVGPPSAVRLRHARCLFHPLREAAALCPHCHGTFCRECVTDEDNQLACPPCLRRMARPPARKPSLWRGMLRAFAGLFALVCLTGLFFLLLRWRVNTPGLHLDFGGLAHDQPAGGGDE
jgi:hypothetical protein